MKILHKFPARPNHKLTINSVNDRSTGFLQAKSAACTFIYADGSSKDMVIDYVDRKKSLDAVVICAWAKINDEDYVYLRSCIRPALDLRNWDETGRPEYYPLNQWELPAGLIENEEKGLKGINNAASRECKEEIGAYVNPNGFAPLGHCVFSSVGISGERLYFVHTEIDPKHVEVATLDGSALEENGEVVLCEMACVMDAIDQGHIQDSKTVIGIERLRKHLINMEFTQ